MVKEVSILITDNMSNDIIELNTSTQVSNNSQTSLNSQLASIFGINSSAINSITTTASRYKLSHGKFAGVPIICKDTDCPYIETCTIPPAERLVNQRCIQELGAIVARFEYWCTHFDIDPLSTNKADLVDLSLIQDMVNLEVKELRADQKMAISADIIEKSVSEVDRKGNVYYENVLNPVAEYQSSLMAKRHKILQLLNSTRKDKASQMDKGNNPSNKAINILKKIDEALGANALAFDDPFAENIIDAEVVETTDKE